MVFCLKLEVFIDMRLMIPWGEADSIGSQSHAGASERFILLPNPRNTFNKQVFQQQGDLDILLKDDPLQITYTDLYTLFFSSRCKNSLFQMTSPYYYQHR